MEKKWKRRSSSVLLPLGHELDDADDTPIRKEHFEVCDIEATKWTQFLIIGHYDGAIYSEFMRLPEYIAFIARRACSEPDGRLTIFAHYGGGYDFNFLIDAIFFSSPYMVTNMIERGSGMLSFDMTGKCDGVKIKITFRDSTAVLPSSQKDLTHTFGVAHKKQDMDHTRVTRVTPKLREYLKFDVKGLHEVLTKYFNLPIFDGVEIGYTVAGQAMRLWRRYLPRPVYALTEPGVDEFVRGAYFGGRVEIFKPWFDGRRTRKKLHCYDVNSLYPTVMRAQDMPVAFSHETYQFEPGELAIYDVTIDIPETDWCPAVPVIATIEGTKKLVFPVGKNIKARLTSIEIDYCRSLGYRIAIEYGIVFVNGGKIFRDYVDDLYALRLKSPPGGVMSVVCKLLMNGLYGRTGLRLERENLVVDDGREGVEPHMVIQGKDGRKISLVKETKIISSFTNVAIATFVTAASRIHMHKIYRQLGRDLYYTDTDSIFTTKKIPTGDGLGELKLEYECEAAAFLLPKTYITTGMSKVKLRRWEPEPGMSIQEISRKLYGDARMTRKLRSWNPNVTEKQWRRWPLWKSLEFESHTKVTMKGFISRKVSHFTLEDFQTALEGDMRRLHAVMPPKFAKLRSAGRRGKLLTMLPASPRQIRAHYDKRRIVRNRDGSLDSLPLLMTPEAGNLGAQVLKTKEIKSCRSSPSVSLSSRPRSRLRPSHSSPKTPRTACRTPRPRARSRPIAPRSRR